MWQINEMEINWYIVVLKIQVFPLVNAIEANTKIVS